MNQMLQCIVGQRDFESACLNLDKLPTVPPYWRRMCGQNQAGPAPLGILTEPPAIRPDELARRINERALGFDCRSPESFGGGHIPDSLNVGRGNAFPTWAGTGLPPDVPMLLILDRASDLWEITWHLLRIGYDLPAGWLAGGVAAWRTEGRPAEMLPQWSVFQLQARLDFDQNLKVLDVRQPNEWQDGHMPRAMYISRGELPQRIAELPQDHPVAVHCGNGYRSSVAASLVQRAGHENVYNVLGGFSAWKNAGLPVER
jgi:hydroxyacylglutathione hydrolase